MFSNIYLSRETKLKEDQKISPPAPSPSFSHSMLFGKPREERKIQRKREKNKKRGAEAGAVGEGRGLGPGAWGEADGDVEELQREEGGGHAGAQPGTACLHVSCCARFRCFWACHSTTWLTVWQIQHGTGSEHAGTQQDGFTIHILFIWIIVGFCGYIFRKFKFSFQ